MTTTTAFKPYAVLQINGQCVQQGTPGDSIIYATFDTFDQALAECERLCEKHDERIVEFNVGELADELGAYRPVEW